MPVHTLLVADTAVELWGLAARERLERVLRRAGLPSPAKDLDSIPPGDPVLLVRIDHLYDERLIRALAESAGVGLLSGPGGPPVAAHVAADQARAAKVAIEEGRPPEALAGVRFEVPERLASGYQRSLRKYEPPFVERVTPERKGELERRLFAGAYKGVTDLVTKWVWPVPARWATRFCVRVGLRPNHVTTLSWILAVVVGFLFLDPALRVWGIPLAWFMTFLDTVDGKLARVTLNSSKFGHLFDHVLDIVHPPLWYFAWGVGLSAFEPGIAGLTLPLAYWMIAAGYVAGRLVEGGFHLWAGFGIFIWRPTDSYLRLVIARRNPSLLFLTAGALAGRPDLGLAAVALWTAASVVLLLARWGVAVWTRSRSGPLSPWLSEVDRDACRRTLAARIFSSGVASPARPQA